MPNKNKRTKRKKAVGNKRKMTAKRKVLRRRAASRSSLLGRKKKFSAKMRRVASTGLVVETIPLPSGERQERRDGQSGDLQGLSNPPMANSESIEELLEEGNAFEAEAVNGVENALEPDQGEVETHEVPEDDVPREYLDKDQ